MTINETIIKDLGYKYKMLLPDELKKYLLVQYAEEPFPEEYTEQDLFANIERDIRAYEAGKLDITMKSPSERWRSVSICKVYILKCATRPGSLQIISLNWNRCLLKMALSLLKWPKAA